MLVLTTDEDDCNYDDRDQIFKMVKRSDDDDKQTWPSCKMCSKSLNEF